MKRIHGLSRRSALLAILISGVLMFVIIGVALAAAPYLVDHFTTGFQNVSCLAPCTLTSTVAAAGVPGGTRDVRIVAGGTAGRQLRVLVDPVVNTTLAFNQETFESGTAHVEWDGNGNPDVLNYVGLNHLDLTQSSTNTGIEIRVLFDDSPINVTIRIYTDQQHWSQATINLPGGITTAAQATSFFVAFPSFTVGAGAVGGATFSDVGALTMDIDGTVTAGADMELDLIQAGGYDFGDLPAAYGVTTLPNGARHLMGGLRLGSVSDAEVDGQPNGTATGDNINPSGGVNDEDGVVPTPGVRWVRGQPGSVNVTVTGCTGTCYLTGWVDWATNNNFTNNGDNIFTDQVVTNGLQTLTFAIPNNAPVGNNSPVTLNARFRLCGALNTCNTTTGAVYNGEVEDYQWGFGPTAITLLSLTANSNAQDAAIAVLAVSIVTMGAVSGVLIAKRRKKTL